MLPSHKANRIYIAGKVGGGEATVQALKSELERRGYVVPYDWTQKPVTKPFEHNPLAEVAADNMLKTAVECDIIIVLCTTEGGAGYFVETGAALVAALVLGFITGQTRKRVIAVGKGNDRSIFFFHKQVERVPSIEVLLERIPAFADA